MNGNEWQKRDGARPNSATRWDLDEKISRRGGEQKQLLRLADLSELGLTRRGASHRVEQRRLWRMHEGVFALHPPPYSWHQRLLAATYACGPHSAVSDMAAAWLLGMTETRPSIPVVTNRTGAGRSTDGIEIHRRTLMRRDVITHYGIPCTAPARTVFDCSPSLPIEELEQLLMAADSGRPRLDRRRLEQLVTQNPGRRGIRNLRLLITDDPKDTDAENERRMLRICRRYGVPEPETQYEIRTPEKDYRADFCWPDLRLIVEADSWRWHGGKLKNEDDRERDQLLIIAGWIVVHFTRNQIKLDPDGTGRKLVALTSR